MNILRLIDKIFAQIAIIFIKLYQYTLSPDKGLPSLRLKDRVCMHEPHCSQYGILSFRRYGFISALPKVIDRVFSCTGGKHKIYDPHKYNIIFFSSAPIGIPFLQKLYSSKRFDIKGIVTMPDKPSDRGMKVKPNIIKVAGEKIFGDSNKTTKVLVLHGLDGNNKENRFPWLKTKLTNQNIQIEIPNLPHSAKPNLEKQLNFLIQNYKDRIDENTIIVGHSLGCFLAKQFIAKINKKINSLILVAPTFNELDIDKLGEEFGFFTPLVPTLKKYHSHKINLNKLQKLVNTTTIFLSQNDPYIPHNIATEYFMKHLKSANILSFKNKGHFNKSAGVTKLTEILPLLHTNKTKIILLHGKDTNSQEKRYPRVTKQLKNKGLDIYCPNLPNSKDPDIKERLKEIDKLQPDENTVLIGHSRGGVAILRRLEKNNQKVKKVILVATNDGKSKYISHGENNKGFYTKDGYNFEKIKQSCSEFTIFHSTDDKRVDYKGGLSITNGLNAKLYTFTDKNHFGGNDKYHYKAITMPQLIDEVIYNDAYYSLIQTPNSLRLDSKKYAEEAHNFKLRLESKKPDYLIVIAYGKIIPQYILDIPKIAPINVHGSLLPKYRGASPLQSIFLNGDKTAGITIMKMDAGMDTGNMIDKLKFKIKFDRTVKNLINELIKRGPKFLNKTLVSYGKRLLGEVKQNEEQTTYCQKIIKEDGEINTQKDKLDTIYKKYRAFAMRPKIYYNFTQAQNNKIKKNKHQTPPLGGEDTGGVKSKPKRIIIEKLILDEKLFAQNKDKLLFEGKKLNKCVTEILLKPEGKKTMNRDAFKTGYLK